jgi:hypothetical protein
MADRIPAEQWLAQAPLRDGAVDFCYASLSEVRTNIQARSRIGIERFRFIEGDVLCTIPQIVPDAIALLRLDTDFYESTLHELTHLYPRLVPGGVLIIDDFGCWNGSRKAVEDYFAEHDRPFFVRDSNIGSRVAIKF